MASVHDVAAYLVKKFGVLGTMKLEKLVYYSQAWWVARNPMPLFDEPLEAWRMGPVCPDLYALHRRQNFVQAWPKGSAANLTAAEAQHIDAISDVYGAYSGFRLGDMTHQERPWNRAMAKGQNSVIEIDDMRTFFRERDAANK